jgi:hypothetical protein
MDKGRLTQKDRMREKIRSSMMLDRLIKCFNGKIELSNVEANIGLKLIGKVLPDLKATEHSGSVDHRHTEELSDDEIATRIARLTQGDSKTAPGKDKPKALH